MRTGMKRIRGIEWDHNPFDSKHDSYRSSHAYDPDIWEHVTGHETEEVPSEIYASYI